VKSSSVDAGERTSSSSRSSGTAPVRQTGFRLHCFPDLPVDNARDVLRCAFSGERFERSHFENSDADCGDDFSGNAKDIVLRNKKARSIAEIEENAYWRGFADGEKKGISDGEKSGRESSLKKIEPVLGSLQEGVLQLKNLHQETYLRIEKEVVHLALAIAQKVICREIKMDSKVVVAVVREALAKVAEPGRIRIKMNPAELEFINETKTHLSGLIQHLDHVVFEADAGISSGGCIIETDLGEIDARIEQQLQAVEETFHAEMEKIALKAIPE
jgi:flagellar assembly protein FliH